MARKSISVRQASGSSSFIAPGHNIDEDVHGEGANMDNYETHDERLVLERTCFSIEPGIYLPEFGVRSEVDVFIAAPDEIEVTGVPIQREVMALLRCCYGALTADGVLTCGSTPRHGRAPSESISADQHSIGQAPEGRSTIERLCGVCLVSGV